MDEYGAFNISIINDLPLFIDPFLLFNSDKEEYRALHDQMICYLVFPRDRAATGTATDARLRLWYCFLRSSRIGSDFRSLAIAAVGLALTLRTLPESVSLK